MMFASALVSAVLVFASAVSALSYDGLPKNNQLVLGEKYTITVKGKGKINAAFVPEAEPCGDAIKEWLGVDPGSELNKSIDGDMKEGDKVLLVVEEDGSNAEVWSQTLTVVAGKNTGSDSASTPGGTATAPTDPNPTDVETPPGGNGGAANVGTNPNEKDGDSGAARAVGASGVAAVAASALLALAFF